MKHWDGWFFLLIGLYQIIHGLIAKHLIYEADFPTTKEEREREPADAQKRVVAVVMGLIGVGYGVIRLFFWH